MDSLENKVKTFFSNAKKMKQNERDSEYETIRNEYYKTLEDADEKVHLANQMYDLVDRYLRRLDQELHKFKMELEADNEGITEILEKRSLELDQPPTNSCQKENRYSFTSSRSRDNHSHCNFQNFKFPLKQYLVCFWLIFALLFLSCSKSIRKTKRLKRVISIDRKENSRGKASAKSSRIATSVSEFRADSCAPQHTSTTGTGVQFCRPC